MGGMGCWELATAGNDMFRAIAPVGAYHRRENRGRIAEALRNTPVFVVHSLGDRLCPLKPEAELWDELDKLGNRVVVKQHVRGGHGDLWSQAYAKDTELWKWFLAQ